MTFGSPKAAMVPTTTSLPSSETSRLVIPIRGKGPTPRASQRGGLAALASWAVIGAPATAASWQVMRIGLMGGLLLPRRAVTVIVRSPRRSPTPTQRAPAASRRRQVGSRARRLWRRPCRQAWHLDGGRAARALDLPTRQLRLHL